MIEVNVRCSECGKLLEPKRSTIIDIDEIRVGTFREVTTNRKLDMGKAPSVIINGQFCSIKCLNTKLQLAVKSCHG